MDMPRKLPDRREPSPEVDQIARLKTSLGAFSVLAVNNERRIK
jgi:hypothetical protein